MTTAMNFSIKQISEKNLYEERSILLELANTATHPSLDDKNRMIASRFLMNQLLKGLQDVDATNMEIKNYLQIFKKVLDKGIIKTSQNKTQWDDALSNKISQLGEEFHLLNYLQTRSNTEGFKVRNIDISENQRLSHLRWKVVEFLKLLS